MSRHKLVTLIAALGVATLAAAAPASAQVLGTFPWQMQPYCNIVTLRLTSAPAGFTLDGTDDQCGATNKASAVGVASFNASGNVTLNFSIVTAPAGKPVHVSAVVSPANGTGTWTDSVGNSGTFAFFGAAPGLPARPLPASGLAAAIITSTEIAPGAVGTTQLATNAVTGANVANGSLTRADLADAPVVASVEPADVTLTTSDVVVATISLTAPAAGRIVANASGYYYTTNGSTLDTARCSLTTGTSYDINRMAYLREFSNSTLYGTPFGLTRVFTVAAGTATINLVCNVFSGEAQARSLSLNGLFVAQ